MRDKKFSNNEKQCYTKIVKEVHKKGNIAVEFYEDCIPSTEIEWVRKLINKKGEIDI